MGGRVYDPVIGRFLSVDPVVRDIGAAQSWNSYGYVEGRVVSWTDPTGWSGCAGKANKNCRLKRRMANACSRATAIGRSAGTGISIPNSPPSTPATQTILVSRAVACGGNQLELMRCSGSTPVKVPPASGHMAKAVVTRRSRTLAVPRSYRMVQPSRRIVEISSIDSCTLRPTRAHPMRRCGRYFRIGSSGLGPGLMGLQELGQLGRRYWQLQLRRHRVTFRKR